MTFRYGDRVRWWALTGLAFAAGCVVVGEPDVQVAAEASSSTSTEEPIGSSGMTSTTTTGTPEPASTDTGDAPPIDAPEFSVFWAVSPSSIVPPENSAGEIRTDVYLISGFSYGDQPAAISDLEAFYADVESSVEAAIPEPDAEGLGVMPRPLWVPAWCDTSDERRNAFAASELGQGLTGDALADAYEATAVEILTEAIARARAVRPNMQWGFHAVPAPEYWEIAARDPDDQYEDWRSCNVGGASPQALWDAVDFTAPELRYFYSVRDDGAYNDSYLYRWVESMRLAGKPVYPWFDGRFLSSSEDDDSIYIGLPYYAEDVELILTQLHAAGASGLLYRLDADGCWDLDADCSAAPPADLQGAVDAYWMDSFSPILDALGDG